MQFNKELQIEENNGILIVTAELQPRLLAREKKVLINTAYVVDVVKTMGYNIESIMEMATVSNFRFPHSGKWKFLLKNESKKKQKKLIEPDIPEKEEMSFEPKSE